MAEPKRFSERQQSPVRRQLLILEIRRKKSKCPGERPECSICSRLQQTCSYEVFEPEARKRKRSPEPIRDAQGDVSKRFGTIEQKLEELAASMKKAAPVSHISPNHVTEDSRGYQQQQSPLQGFHSSVARVASLNSAIEGLPPDVVEDGVKTYFMAFHAQPYNLMCQRESLRPGHVIDPVVLDSMLALSIRCSSHPFWSDQSKLNDCIRALTDDSWKKLVNLYSRGDTSLPYLQGLCLLAQVDFADGRVQRAHTQISLGVRIAQSLGYLTEPARLEERSEEIVRCTWTLFMLDRTFSITRLVSPSLPYQEFRLPKPHWEGALSLNPMYHNLSTETSLGSGQDLSALLVGVYAIWDDVIRYVFATTSNSTTPPWQPGSELATIEYRFADFEPDFSTHRYREVDFPRRAIQEPHLRPYFASWLCFQLTYMHHPFIMFIKLQHVIRKVPPSFLQKSYKSSLIHSRWIIRFLNEMDEAGMMLHDPFVGYLAAIAATIQLEHTLSKHSDVAAAARLSFASAVRYLKKLSKYWTSIQELDDYDGILPAVESERVGLAGDDAELMWKVFDYASMSALSGKRPRNNPEGANKTKQGSDGVLVAQPERQVGNPNVFASVQPSGVCLTGGNAAPAPKDFPNMQAPEGMLEQPNLLPFEELPEDWAFTIDDWTLFGAPGSTYF
ncbi:hypothetical protein MBM_03190 [Drepanopeziza brunnea f. sp. 'multigermtubi' MB_m1]|uniref:Xylanolytic transcriptional activator regulatory domain-containing protein n=1 Tax=Marssonina brunnea f. sp. multigermtubi (strain MB_m1) TaxID=1072389 RepID=K1XDJ9_MARBU|nr:uncharacterized protein MBM_03190 [Drepanopeziza brunnea f. sp. 'multigermtubi' MB_m1]EKD18948.1 hypothetical protein MBM_03190 [Drepanopeziza brunnea f. sp. 'multigermtubi' MB_m1]